MDIFNALVDNFGFIVAALMGIVTLAMLYEYGFNAGRGDRK
jgi:hypothetical protein